MYRKSKKLIVWALVVSMILTNMLFTNVAFAAEKYAGNDRYATAAAIAEAMGESEYAVIAYGEDYPDALAAAPLAAAYDAPILLTDKNELNDSTADALESLAVKKVIIVGGEGVVSAAVAEEIEALGIEVEDRLAGNSRIETALAIAEALEAKLGKAPATVFVANAYGFADALSVSPIAAAMGAPILLVGTDADAVADYIGDAEVYVVGGTAVVSPEVEEALGATRLAGNGRYATNLAIIEEFVDELEFANVYLATGENYPDALAGSVLAASKKAPLVLVAADGIADDTMDFLAENATEETAVYAFGGLKAVVNASDDLTDELVGEVPAELEVKSVTALNSVTVAVEFNKAVDESSAEDETLYVLTAVEDEDPELTVTEAELQDDEKTVYLTLDDATALPDDDTDYTVFVSDVEDVDGEEMNEYKEIVSLKDDVRPTVESAKFADNDSFEIVFSEPVVEIDNEDDVRNSVAIEVVDEDDDEVEGVGLEYDDEDRDTLTLTGLSALDEDEVYTIRIFSDVQDFTGNVITPNPYEKTFTVSEDDDDPKVTSLTVISKQAFKVVFNEPIAEGDDGYFTVDIGSEADVDATIEAVDDTNNKEFTVDLGDDADFDGLVKVKVYGFQDVSGNPTDEDEDTGLPDSSYSKLVKFKDVAPTLVSTVGKSKTMGGSKYVVFQFGGEIDGLNPEDLTADRTDDSVVYDEDVAAELFFIEDTADAPSSLDDDELAILVEDLEVGDYELTLPEGFVTAYGAEIEETDVTFTVTESDSDVEVDDENEVYPIDAEAAINGNTEGESLEANNNEIIVVFTDEVDNSAINAANYTIDGSKVFDKAQFYASDDKDTVRLTLKEGAVKYNGKYVFEMKNLKDADGNEMDDFKATVLMTENTKPYITKAEVTDIDTIEVTFSEALEEAEAGDLDADDFVITVGSKEVDVTDLVLDGKVITLTLDEEIEDEDVTVKVKTSKDFNLVDGNGNKGKTNYEKTASWNLD